MKISLLTCLVEYDEGVEPREERGGRSITLLDITRHGNNLLPKNAACDKPPNFVYFKIKVK